MADVAILTREEFNELARDIYSYWRAGSPVDNEHLIEQYISETDALLDAHDAALDTVQDYDERLDWAKQHLDAIIEIAVGSGGHGLSADRVAEIAACAVTGKYPPERPALATESQRLEGE